MDLVKSGKSFWTRLHDDESAAGTIEWILLVIVALVVLIGIYYFVNWGSKSVQQGQSDINAQKTATNTEMLNMQSKSIGTLK